MYKLSKYTGVGYSPKNLKGEFQNQQPTTEAVGLREERSIYAAIKRKRRAKNI